MAGKRENQMAVFLRSQGVPEAKVPEAEKGMTTAYFVVRRIGVRAGRKRRRRR